MTESNTIRTNYWDTLIDDPYITKEQFFIIVRSLYINMLKHVYNDKRDIPDVKVHFCTEQRSLEEGSRKGYPIITVSSLGTHKSIIRDISEIENFSYSYSWYHDNIFVVIDFRENGISPLQFITSQFFTELMRQLRMLGAKRISLSHMNEPLISAGVVQFFYGYYRLDINLLQTLSALTYEGSFIDSTIYVLRNEYTGPVRNIESGLDIAFKLPVAFTVENLRQIRKMLELSDKYVALVLNNKGEIYGLTTGDMWPGECKVRIWGHLTWTITYEGERKISYYNAGYHIYSSEKHGYSLIDSLGSLGTILSENQLYNIGRVLRTAIHQHHGTIILIGTAEDIKSESNRLCEVKNATGIYPAVLSEKISLLNYLTSIDGAILMDLDCRCTCIGAILDGDTVVTGSPARGSRYNSTVNYVARRRQLGKNFVGIVISEDGTVDAVSDAGVQKLNLEN